MGIYTIVPYVWLLPRFKDEGSFYWTNQLKETNLILTYILYIVSW